MTPPDDWYLEGTYFESCNCDAVCPCRPQGDRPGGRSTYGVCDWALSWRCERGQADDLALGGREVVMAGRYDDDEPDSPWRVALYLDEGADPDQRQALTDIFLGRAGGATLSSWATSITEVYAVRPARIVLDHTPDQPSIDVEDHVTVRALEPVDTNETIACAIPGYDNPGTEYQCEVLRVDEAPLRWEVTGRCGFATEFAYGTSS